MLSPIVIIITYLFNGVTLDLSLTKALPLAPSFQYHNWLLDFKTNMLWFNKVNENREKKSHFSNKIWPILTGLFDSFLLKIFFHIFVYIYFFHLDSENCLLFVLVGHECSSPNTNWRHHGWWERRHVKGTWSMSLKDSFCGNTELPLFHPILKIEDKVHIPLSSLQLSNFLL